jgi:serine/threonine-protein kinase
MNQHPAYELFEELGRGSNTVVYRSYDLSLGREVAIKELDENSRRDQRQRERLLREAQFLAQFEHDNVLRVYSVDTERGWIIMELMKGTLASVIASGPSDPDLVRSILKQTLEALAFLHEKNKVHSTVRPTNLLINEAGRVKLSEFEQTDVGGELRAPKGSKKYLAPELIRPEFGEFGPPLDLYCLAFTALELLKGPQFESLFPGTGKGAIDADMAWLRWHSSPDELPSTRKLVSGIPNDLAHVLDQMLKKRVADRPQSAQAVLDELADRPLIAVPIAGIENEAPTSEMHHGAAVVRTLAAPQTLTPNGSSPVRSVDDLATPRSGGSSKPRAGKSAKTTTKPPAKPFSKGWFNEQLGRPYVLYPLCAFILLGALWFSFAPSSGPEMVAVTFEVAPDAKGVEVVEGESKIERTNDGKYAFVVGRHAVVFRKDGFKALAREIEVSAEQNTFRVKLDPIIKYNDVVVQVTPANAQLKAGGAVQPTANGNFTLKVEQGKPLELATQLEGYVAVTRTIAADELEKLGNKVSISMDREKPRLPASLVAKPGAPLDAELQYPTRVLAKKFGDAEPMELVLVKPGTYAYGASEDRRRPNEVARRTVRIEKPFYIAIHETTNAQYNRFFEAEGESKAGSRWQAAARKWTLPLGIDPVNNKLPVTNVSAEQAQVFCSWVGGKLPTEIEWESAVRGLNDRGYPYAWGSTRPDSEHCRIFHFTVQKLERGDGGPVAVDQLPAGASPLGLMHAIGNAAEWCHDSEQRGGFILRGCSIATANINDVRVTWRGQGEPAGEQFTGFRVIVPLSSELPKTEVPSSVAADGGGPISAATPLALFTLIPWKTLASAVGSTHERDISNADSASKK